MFWILCSSLILSLITEEEGEAVGELGGLPWDEGASRVLQGFLGWFQVLESPFQRSAFQGSASGCSESEGKGVFEV